MRTKIDLKLFFIFLLHFFLLFILFAYRELGVTSDSVLYLDLANNIEKGLGPKSILNTWHFSVHHPPLYVWLLSFMKGLGFDVLFAVGLLNSLCYALVVGFVYRILQLSGMKFKFLILFILALCLSEIFLYPFLMVWTEPVFMVFTFAAIFSFLKFARGEQMFYFYVAIIMSAFALLTRYSGFSLLIWGSFFILFFCPNMSLFKRLVLSFVYLLLSALPTLLWLLYTLSLIDKNRFQFSATNEFSFHIISIAHFRQLIRTLLFFIFPDFVLSQIKNSNELQTIIFLIFCILLALFFAGTYVLLKRESQTIANFTRSEGDKILKCEFALIGFFLIYMSFLFFSISFLDFNTPLDYRICAPGVAVLGSGCFCLLLRFTKYLKKFCKLVISLSFGVFIYVSIRAIFLFNNFIHEGFGYTSDGWRKSKIIEFIHQDEYEIYSNSVDGIYFTLGQFTRAIPSKINRNTCREIDKFSDNFKELIRTLRNPERDTLIVYFNRIPTSGIPMAEEFLEHVKVDEIYNFDDGVILYYAKKNADRLD